MNTVEYIEKLIEEMEKDYKLDGYINESVDNFRRGVIFGMKYVVCSLKNPMDFDEKGE